MSVPELLEAVRDQLVFQYDWREFREVSIEIDGQPPPNASGFKDFYVAIHLTDYVPGELNETNPGLHETIGFVCTVSKKISAVPKNQLRFAAFDQIKGLYVVARKVMLALHFNYDVMTKANQSLSGNKFIYPPYWKGTDPKPRLEDGSWLGATSDEAIEKNCCLVTDVRFGGIERIQCITDPPT